MQQSFINTDNQFQRFLQLLALVFFGYAAFLWGTGREGIGFAILGGFYSWLFSYYFSKEFVDRYKPGSVIQRDGDIILFRQFKGVMKSSKYLEERIELQRISTMTIGDNYVSVILDGNGNGYDFVLKAKRADIISHIDAILNEEERSNIKIKKV